MNARSPWSRMKKYTGSTRQFGDDPGLWAAVFPQYTRRGEPAVFEWSLCTVDRNAPKGYQILASGTASSYQQARTEAEDAYSNRRVTV